MSITNSKFRHKFIPDNWLRYSEVAHRFGVPTKRVTAWVRSGYLTAIPYRRVRYLSWSAVLANPLMRRYYESYLSRLEAEEDLELPPRPRRKDPVMAEPVFSEGGL